MQKTHLTHTAPVVGSQEGTGRARSQSDPAQGEAEARAQAQSYLGGDLYCALFPPSPSVKALAEQLRALEEKVKALEKTVQDLTQERNDSKKDTAGSSSDAGVVEKSGARGSGSTDASLESTEQVQSEAESIVIQALTQTRISRSGASGTRVFIPRGMQHVAEWSKLKEVLVIFKSLIEENSWGGYDLNDVEGNDFDMERRKTSSLGWIDDALESLDEPLHAVWDFNSNNILHCLAQVLSSNFSIHDTAMDVQFRSMGRDSTPCSTLG